MTIKELVNKIKAANEAYRKGEAILSDEAYDELLDELAVLDPQNELLDRIGLEVAEDDDRKEALPITMASMNKVKTLEEIQDWFKSKKLDQETQIVITPKYDGISLCVEEKTNKAWTRGNGKVGQKSDEHLKRIDRNPIQLEEQAYSYGELIMPRAVFEKNYKEQFSNPRNLVAGQINQKKPGPILEDCHYLVFGIIGKTFSTKTDMLDYINSYQKNKVPYLRTRIDQMSDESLKEIFQKWSEAYELDGVILEVNELELCEQLGRETNSNPAFARAYKGNFEEVRETTIKQVSWSVSKQGFLKPVLQVETIRLDGVNVSNVTGNNARFVKNLNLGAGSIISVKRSGMVIPKLVEVIHASGFEMPVIEGVELGWNATETELMTLTETPEQRYKSLVSFFEILEVDQLGEGTLKLFFEKGFDTPAKVLGIKMSDMINFDGFGEKKAQNILDAIAEKKVVTRSRLQHASGFFQNLGSKKLLLVEHLDERATIDEIVAVEGFSEISAHSFLDGITKFNEWIKELDGLVEIIMTERFQAESNELEGQVFVFTGVRRKDLEALILEKGGKMGSDVNSKTTYLVMKEKGSRSSKEKKAQKLNKQIITVEELEGLL